MQTDGREPTGELWEPEKAHEREEEEAREKRKGSMDRYKTEEKQGHERKVEKGAHAYKS